ncbi:protein traS [Salmonella enterica]|nr:protein traS [Salmonella enterica]
MKKSELEKDVDDLLKRLVSSDYDIPENSGVMKILLRKLFMVTFIGVALVSLNFLLYQDEWRDLLAVLVFSILPLAIFSLVFIASLYQPVSMYLSLTDEIKESSLVVQLLIKKVRHYWHVLFALNCAVGIVLLFIDDGFVVGFGAAWFVTYIMGTIAFQTSLSRYMPPAVVSSLSKVKELLSASPK